jgi:hypothetical protein
MDAVFEAAPEGSSDVNNFFLGEFRENEGRKVDFTNQPKPRIGASVNRGEEAKTRKRLQTKGISTFSRAHSVPDAEKSCAWGAAIIAGCDCREAGPPGHYKKSFFGPRKNADFESFIKPAWILVGMGDGG